MCDVLAADQPAVSPGRDVERVGGMQIRRPLAGFFVAVTLLGGGAALTGCDPTEATTGTPKDNAQITDGADPHGEEQGNLPDTSNGQGDQPGGPDVGNG